MKPHILYEDAHLLVCYKPAGVPVQSAGVGKQDCVSILKNYLYEGQKNGEPYVGIIHRLDQPVEGILAFAKTPVAARELSSQVRDGSMQKFYLALCQEKKIDKICGKNVDNVDILVDKSGIYRDFLLKNGKTNTSEVVPPQTKGAKLAELEYEILSEKEGTKLVKIRLITGRHHQIRVQMAYHGYPLVGDTKYYPQSMETGAVDNTVRNHQGTALCAYCLAFSHPKTKKPLHFEVCPRHPLLKEAWEDFCCHASERGC